MLELINAERTKAARNPVVLGNNIAAQLHAESALENCFISHWGIDGLKPHMRYTLAGGHQSNAENGIGRKSCIKSASGYGAITSIKQRIRGAVQDLMASPGHRRNILQEWHKKVNIGLAWDRYNFVAFQHFEGDYIEYDRLPAIVNGVLTLSGRVRNGVLTDEDQDMDVQIFYDPPPQTLTRDQLFWTSCYDYGLPIASLRPPPGRNRFYKDHEYKTLSMRCLNPYHVDTPGVQATSGPQEYTVLWITAQSWDIDIETFSVRADISHLLKDHGEGVYSLLIWSRVEREDVVERDVVISVYPIFHGITPPDTYSAGE